MQQDQIPQLLDLKHELFPGTEEFGHGKKQDSAKLLIVGDSGIGKTCLLNKIMDRKYQTEHIPTKGVNQGYLNLKIGNDIHKMVVWDTAGTQGFQANYMKQLNPIQFQGFSRSVVCVFLTYDITRRDTFENVAEWLNQAQQYSTGENGNVIKYYLIGTKRDLKNERQVQFDHAVAFAKHHKIDKVFETSAKEDFKIKPCFLCAANDIVKPDTVDENAKTTYQDRCGYRDNIVEKATQFHQVRNNAGRFKEAPSNYILDQTRKGNLRTDKPFTEVPDIGADSGQYYLGQQINKVDKWGRNMTAKKTFYTTQSYQHQSQMSDIIKHNDGDLNQRKEDGFTLDPTKTTYTKGKEFFDGTKKNKKGEYHLTGHANTFEDYDTGDQKDLINARRNMRYVRDDPYDETVNRQNQGLQRVSALDKVNKFQPKRQGRAMVHIASDTMRHSNVDLDHATHYKQGWNDPNQEPQMKEYLRKKYQGHGTTPHHAKQMALNGVSKFENNAIGTAKANRESYLHSGSHH